MGKGPQPVNPAARFRNEDLGFGGRSRFTRRLEIEVHRAFWDRTADEHKIQFTHLPPAATVLPWAVVLCCSLWL